MKKLLGISLLVFIYSCNNETIKNEIIDEGHTDTSTIVEPVIETTTDTINLAVQENPLTIEDFPKRWYKLDKQDEDFVVNEYCEAETKQLSIEYNDEIGWRVLVSYGQDGMWFKVVEFEAYEEMKENFEVMYGTFILENPDYPDSDPELYSFSWNKDLKFATFEGFFQEEITMVSKQNLDNYELIKENCDYLDGQ